MIIAISCNKQKNSVNTNEDTGTTVNLIAPSGLKIASSIADLKALIDPTVKIKLGNGNYTISQVDYVDSKTGYGALIYLKTDSGKLTTVFIANGIKFKAKVNNSLAINDTNPLFKTMSDGSGDGGSQTYYCAGPPCCLVGYYFDTNGEVIIDCGCDAYCQITQGPPPPPVL